MSGGRGVGAPQKFPEVIQPLADALGGAMGAIRPVVDAGWLPHEYQVGSSGQVVSRSSTSRAGISGAIQHLVGMKTSNYIIAINKDPDAPIFEVANLGVVGDLFEIVPALTAGGERRPRAERGRARSSPTTPHRRPCARLHVDRSLREEYAQTTGARADLVSGAGRPTRPKPS